MTSDSPDPARTFERVRELFLRVVELTPDEREQALLGEDAEIRAEVLRLCECDSAAQDPTPHTPSAQNVALTRAGAYRLGSLLGSGGASEVYLGESEAPGSPAVAIKILRERCLEPQRQRFAREAEILARLDHPRLARVRDAGELEDGRPFLVLDLVPNAQPLGAFCDSRRLSLANRLSLLVQICDAMAYVHERGVLHRDLKPSNLLATEARGSREVFIIDFGIAKLLDQPDDTAITRTGSWRGTPGYMSPEQTDARRRDIDERADVYSLGVIASELLCGARPESALDRRPSALLTAIGLDSESVREIAFQRGTTPLELWRELRGPLDWIISRAVEPDRDRRTPSMRVLREDLARFLAGFPVLGFATSLRYRGRLFFRRHRAKITASAIVLLGAAAAVGYALRQRAVLEGAIGQHLAVAEIEIALAEALRAENPNVPTRALSALGSADRAIAAAAEFLAAPLAPAEPAALQRLRTSSAALGQLFQAQKALRTSLALLQTSSGKHRARTQLAEIQPALESLGFEIDSLDPSRVDAWFAAPRSAALSEIAAHLLLRAGTQYVALGDAPRGSLLRAAALRFLGDRFPSEEVLRDAFALRERARELDWGKLSPLQAIGISGALLEDRATPPEMLELVAAGIRRCSVAHPKDGTLLFQHGRILYRIAKADPTPDPATFRAAAEAYRAALAVAPEFDAAWIWAAECEASLDLEQAVRTLEAAVGNLPRSPYAAERLARLHRMLGHAEEEAEAYHVALASEPEFAPALIGLAQLAIDRKDYPVARDYAMRACARDPDWFVPFQALAWVDRDSHRMPDAIRAAREVLRLQWAVAGDQLMLAELLAHEGSALESAELYRCAAERGGEVGSSWLHAARQAWIARRSDLARFALLRAASSGARNDERFEALRAELGVAPGDLELSEPSLDTLREMHDWALFHAARVVIDRRGEDSAVANLLSRAVTLATSDAQDPSTMALAHHRLQLWSNVDATSSWMARIRRAEPSNSASSTRDFASIVEAAISLRNRTLPDPYVPKR